MYAVCHNQSSNGLEIRIVSANNVQCEKKNQLCFPPPFSQVLFVKHWHQGDTHFKKCHVVSCCFCFHFVLAFVFGWLAVVLVLLVVFLVFVFLPF